jgi:hypothetical protein
MMTTTPAVILAVLLALHRPPQPHRTCIEAHRAQIEAAGAEAESIGVPAAILFAVARRESHFACAPGERSWGAPVDRRHRHTAGGPMHAARALARSFAVCGTWRGAVGRFRSGLCDPWQPMHRSYVASVMRDVETIHARTGTPLPSPFR